MNHINHLSIGKNVDMFFFRKSAVIDLEIIRIIALVRFLALKWMWRIKQLISAHLNQKKYNN